MRRIIKLKSEDLIDDIKELFAKYKLDIINSGRDYAPLRIAVRNTENGEVTAYRDLGHVLDLQLVDDLYYVDVILQPEGKELLDSFPIFDYKLDITTSTKPEIIGHGVNPGTFLFSVPKMDWIESLEIILDVRNRELN